MISSTSIYKAIFSLSITITTLNLNAAILGSDMGLFLEPSVTYENGNTSINYPSPVSSSSGTSNGFGLGARVGIHLYESFFLGLDGRYSMPQYKDSSVGYNSKSVSTNWAPVIGMQTPIVGLRVWGSYIFAGELNPEKSGDFDVKFDSAQGYRVGAGFRLAIVSLNLEYQNLKYDETTIEQIGPFASNTSLNGVELENKSWIVSVSFPLEL